jgi:protein-tyrosine phosphatase
VDAVNRWATGEPGVLWLPSGRGIRGRSLRQQANPTVVADFTVAISGKPTAVDHAYTWLQWPDFRLPSDGDNARRVLEDVWQRSEFERVEVACGGGRGRTGTALACIAVLDGVPAEDAVRFVRANYHRHAVETPWQKRFVERFGAT